MPIYSRKVNKRRHIRQIKRQCVHQIFAPVGDSSLDDSDNDHQSSQTQHHEQKHSEDRSDQTMENDHMSVLSCNDYIDEDTNWIGEDGYENDMRPLYDGAPVTVDRAVRLISSFYSNINLDKQKINNLLHLIKSPLSKPNRLPSTLKRMNKILRHTSSISTTFLCADCFHSCDASGINSKTCINPICTKFSRLLRSTEIVEIVRFDIRTQIQLVMTQNVEFLNKSHLFPPSDICFGELYQHQSNSNDNRITLIVHTDGAPLVRSSKQSIWPCFASIVEIPPPMREFQSNIIILALWASKKKPNPNIFLEQTINDLSSLISNGTSIFIGHHEYQIQLATQFFVSDLPAKAIFCCTTNFNGYSACTYCSSKGMPSFLSCLLFSSFHDSNFPCFRYLEWGFQQSSLSTCM